MIPIDQNCQLFCGDCLEVMKQIPDGSVDLDFEPRFVTKDEINGVRIWDYKPDRNEHGWLIDRASRVVDYPYLKLAEFTNKHWTECIYEVPRKTTGKIEKLPVNVDWVDIKDQTVVLSNECLINMYAKITTLIDAVNELKGAKNE